jgi:hypothetical protein
MKNYLTIKLKKAISDIENITNNVVRSAQELDIKNIQSNTAKLQIVNERYSELSKDAALFLSVNDVIELLNLKLVKQYEVSYVYKYDKSISLQERDLLSKIAYEFRDAKVK